MSDLFQEHKRFIVSLVAGGLGFVVLWLVIGAIFQGDIESSRRNMTKHRADLANAVPPQQVKQAQEGAERADKAVQSLVKSMTRVPDAVALDTGARGTLALPPNEPSPDLYFNRVRESLRAKQLEDCAIQNIDVDPDLGLPDAFPSSAREFDWYLRGLDVVKQVLDTALATESAVGIGIARIDKIDISPVPKTRPAANAQDFVTEHKVSFVVVAHPQAVFHLVDELAKRREDGRFLEVSSATIRSLDAPPDSAAKVAKGVDPADRDRVEARLDLVALDVNPAGRLAQLGRTK